MSEISEYRENFLVCRHDGDCNGKMKPGAMLRYAQQVATDQCNLLGFDRAFYERTHTAFLLAKQELRIFRLPDVDEVLTFLTQPEKSKRACNRRVTQLIDEQGQVVAVLDSLWTLVDTDTRRIIRKPGPEFELAWLDEVPIRYPIKITAAEDAGPVGTATASWSLCDINGHLNNTRYADIVCDSMPPALQQQAPASMVIAYHREVPMGETMELFAGITPDGSWYVRGEREGLKAFEATVCFAVKE